MLFIKTKSHAGDARIKVTVLAFESKDAVMEHLEAIDDKRPLCVDDRPACATPYDLAEEHWIETASVAAAREGFEAAGLAYVGDIVAEHGWDIPLYYTEDYVWSLEPYDMFEAYIAWAQGLTGDHWAVIGTEDDLAEAYRAAVAGGDDSFAGAIRAIMEQEGLNGIASVH
jgi:hypothetical protein